MTTVAAVRRVVAITLLLVGMVSMAGCHWLADLEGYEVSPVATKVDLLLVVDTSRGTIMADKVELFDNAIRDLLAGLTQYVDDIHVGVVSNSLGSYGADSCKDGLKNEKAHLLSRGADGKVVPTYQDLGFLVWDHAQTASPPGHNDLDALKTQLREIVVGAGSEGCGFESTLEAWYRFLVEPAPYSKIEIIDEVAVPKGLDEALLAQRRAFLRPDSLLMVVVLSDENDCSLRVGGSNYLALQVEQPGGGEPYHLSRPRAGCALNPHDACCLSCGQPSPAGCDDSKDDCDTTLTSEEDPVSLRCFDQQRRFGVDFLNPIDRYVAGLGAKQVANYAGDMRLNPLFEGGRDPRLIVYGAIVGVPWQDITRRTELGVPDIEKGLQTPREMVKLGTWDMILGDPDTYHTPNAKWPSDALMRESREPRTEVKGLEGALHPLLGEPLAPPSAGYYANSINSHEHQLSNELQYACVFELRDDGVDCSDSSAGCVCGTNPGKNDPLCQDPESGEYTSSQRLVQAYPGIRHLQLLKRLGDRAVVGSICPSKAAWAPFAYQPATRALLETATPYLKR